MPDSFLPPTALLWDLDNVDPGAAHWEALARALSLQVGPDARRIAAAHRGLYRRASGSITAVGFEVLSGGRHCDGADLMLLDRALALHRTGVTLFVVASNDHLFAEIAAFADLHVLTLQPRLLSRKLCRAACTVTVLRPSTVGAARRKRRRGQRSTVPAAVRSRPPKRGITAVHGGCSF